MNSFLQMLVDWVKKNPYKVTGVISGFLIALLIVLIGVWKALFVFLITAFGFLLGKAKDEERPISEIFRNLKNFFRR